MTPYPPERLPLARALRGEEVREELIYVRHHGQPGGVWISVNSGPVKDGDDETCGGVVTFRDVTESQNLLRSHVSEPSPSHAPKLRDTDTLCAECPVLGRFEQFRSVYAQLCRVVEETADGVLITDRSGIIEYVNPSFEETTGYSKEEVLGGTPRVFKSGLHDKQFYQDMWSQLLAGEHFRGTIANRKKSGELYWSEQTITPLKDERQQITHFVSVQKDITELRKQQYHDFQMSFAREVQQRFYDVSSSVPGFDIAGHAFPADDTGGDYFDIIVQPDGSVYLVIADVSGHGFGSALLMAETRAYVRAFADCGDDLGALLTRVNQALAADLDGVRYVTLTAVRLGPRGRSFSYASAGHVPGYLLGRSDEVRFVLDSLDPPLGLFQNLEFSSSPVMELGDEETLVLLTDGVTEAANGDATEFGAERALDFVRGHRGAGARDLVEGLYEAVRDFNSGSSQHDDITSVVCKTKPKEAMHLVRGHDSPKDHIP
jgi:sigma-B regulation protein RsbU (phosphoserine phosphatase)